jgi:transcription initiation factor TFIID subunit 5
MRDRSDTALASPPLLFNALTHLFVPSTPQPELLRVLYPMFVYCHLELVSADVPELTREFHRRFATDHTLLHHDETVALAGLATPAHLSSDPTALKFKNNRMSVRVCAYTFDLLVKYLHVANQMALLAILNGNISVSVTDGDPVPGEDENAVAARATITGTGPPSKVDVFNAKKHGRWGLLETSIEVRAMDEFDDEKLRLEKENGKDDDDNKAKAGKKGGTKKAPELESVTKEDPDADDDRDLPTIVKSEIPIPTLAHDAALDAVEDVRYRALVGPCPGKLPSCAFYTFTHAHAVLNCASASLDASLVVGGFADSVVRLWDMNKAVPGGTDKYETDPASRARRAAKDAALDAPAADRGEGGGDVEMQVADGDGDDGATIVAIGVFPNPQSQTNHPVGGVQKGSKVARPAPCVEFVGHASAVHGVSISPGNEFLLSSSRDSTVRVWSVALETCLASYKAHDYPVWDVQWCPVGHYFATASYDGTARVFAMDAPAPRRVMVGHLADVDCVAWHPNCNYIATGSADKTVRLWDVASGECVRVFVGHSGGVAALAVSPRGDAVASSGDDGSVLVWDLGTSRCVHHFVGHVGAVHSLEWAFGRGDLLASGGADETVRLWDTSASSGSDAGASAKPLRKTVGGVRGGDFSVAKRGPVQTLRTKNTPVCAVGFTGRNVLLAMGARAPKNETT